MYNLASHLCFCFWKIYGKIFLLGKRTKILFEINMGYENFKPVKSEKVADEMNNKQEKIEKDEFLDVRTERVLDEKMAEDLIKVQEKALPPDKDPLDDRISEEEFRELIKDPKVVLCVLEKDKDIIGYGFARPLKDAIDDIAKYDPEILKTKLTKEEEKEIYYGDTIAIFPEYRKFGLGAELLKTIFQDLRKIGVKKVTFHTRASRKRFTPLMKDSFEKESLSRQIDNFLNSGIKIDYLEIEL